MAATAIGIEGRRLIEKASSASQEVVRRAHVAEYCELSQVSPHYTCHVAGKRKKQYTSVMPNAATLPVRALTFVRKPNLINNSHFAVGLHHDNLVEAVFEGTRNAVIAWSCQIAPELALPITRCLDLLAVLPAQIVQRVSLNTLSTACVQGMVRANTSLCTLDHGA